MIRFRKRVVITLLILHIASLIITSTISYIIFHTPSEQSICMYAPFLIAISSSHRNLWFQSKENHQKENPKALICFDKASVLFLDLCQCVHLKRFLTHTFQALLQGLCN